MRWLRWDVAGWFVAACTALAVLVAAGGAAAAGSTLTATQNAKLGSVLSGPSGLTLYYYAKDTNGVSNCTGGCAGVWPPLTVTGTPTAGTGVGGAIGTLTRSDGTVQVTYNGWPLYYYAADQKPGDTTGQGVAGVWSVATAAVSTAPMTGAATSSTSSSAASSTAASSSAASSSAASSTAASSTTAAASATVSVAQNAQLGPTLVGPKGMTLYYRTKDSNGVSACTGSCATAWPPLTASGAPTAGAGASGTLGTIQRSDGTTQVTYQGWPLYYYGADQKPGDAMGEKIGGVWFVAPPVLTVAAAAAAAAAPAVAAPAAAAPAATATATTTLPQTGRGPWPLAAGVLLLACGALLLTRPRMARR